MRLILVIFLTALVSTGFSQRCDTYFYGNFVPTTQTPDDSVFYLFSIAGVYELHANKEYRIIYDVKWFDHCKFDLITNESSDEQNPIIKGTVFHCSASYVDDSTAQLIINDKPLLLESYNE